MRLRLAAVAVLASPFARLRFRGGYGETAGFRCFTSHADPEVAAAAGARRRAEFAACGRQGEVPEPPDRATYARSVRGRRPQPGLREFDKELIRLRKTAPALVSDDLEAREVVGFEGPRAHFVHRRAGGDEVWLVLAFSATTESLMPPIPPGHWQPRLGGGAAPQVVAGSRLTPGPWSAALPGRAG